jgi:hypothetical protein
MVPDFVLLGQHKSLHRRRDATAIRGCFFGQWKSQRNLGGHRIFDSSAHPTPAQISSNGTNATVTVAAGMGLLTGDRFRVEGASQPEFNGFFSVFSHAGDSFSYQLAKPPDNASTVAQAGPSLWRDLAPHGARDAHRLCAASASASDARPPLFGWPTASSPAPPQSSAQPRKTDRPDRPGADRGITFGWPCSVAPGTRPPARQPARSTPQQRAQLSSAHSPDSQAAEHSGAWQWRPSLFDCRFHNTSS